VDAVNVGITHRRGCRAEIDVLRPRFAGHLDDLLAGRAADDGVIHQQYVLAAEFQFHRIELLAHRLLPRGPVGHDEGTADIAVLDAALTELDAKVIGQLHRRGTAGIGDRHYRDATPSRLAA